MSSLCIAATRATLGSLPAARQRRYAAAMGGLCLIAVTVAIYNARRTSARPPRCGDSRRECRCRRATGNPDKFADLPLAQGPEFWQPGEHAGGGRRPDARHGLQQAIADAPQRTGLDAHAQISIGVADLFLPSDVRQQILADGAARERQAIPLGRQHLDELAPPRDQRLQVRLQSSAIGRGRARAGWQLAEPRHPARRFFGGPGHRKARTCRGLTTATGRRPRAPRDPVS